MLKAMLRQVERIGRIYGKQNRRPWILSGESRQVTDLRTGETLTYSVQVVARDAQGRIRTTKTLTPRQLRA